MDQITAKRYGQWTTRLYIILLVSSLGIVATYTIIDPQSLTKTFDKPVFDVYKQLKHKYGDQLQCSCLMTASTYNQYVQIQPVFHQVKNRHFNFISSNG